MSFDHSADFPWRFNDRLTGQWHWQRLGSITGLWRGNHQFHLKLREEQTQVDKFLITSDALFVPQGLGNPAENRCSNPQPGAGQECNPCDPVVNLGDLVVLNDPYFPNDAFKGWPAIVVGSEAGHYALLTHRVVPHQPPYAKPQGAQGRGFPYDWNIHRVVVSGSDPSWHTLIVPQRSFEQYLDCRGRLSLQFRPNQGTYTGTFRSTDGWQGAIEILPGVMPSGISTGEYDNMRLQGMLHSSENTVFYPLISSTLHPLGREGEVVIREIVNSPYPVANRYGLGVIECWNANRPANAKIISLTDLVGPGKPSAGLIAPSQPPIDPRALTCLAVHLRPSVFDVTETGSFSSYVCTDCGVIRRIDRPQGRYENGKLGDSDQALVFEATRECYVLPQGVHFGSWANLEGKRYRLAGFREHADPAGTGFGQVRIGGVTYRRLGFLAAPIATIPCTESTGTRYSLRVSSGSGGHVNPAAGTFTYTSRTQVTLAAVADKGYVFDGWTTTGIPAGTINPAHPTVSFRMNGNYTLHAKFKRTSTTYTLRVSSDAGGRVTPSAGTYTYTQGTVVVLTAVADPGYAFDGWTTTGIPAGVINPASSSVFFPMNGNYTLHAKFKRTSTTYTLRVSSDAGGPVLPYEGNFTYLAGIWVVLTAVADPGFAFDGWITTGLPTGIINPASLGIQSTVNGNYTLHARFKRIHTPVTYTLRVTSSPLGQVMPAVGTFTYNQGTSVTLEAVPDPGYVFSQWLTTGIPVGAIDRTRAKVTIVMNGNYTIYASFERAPEPRPNLTDGGALYHNLQPQVVARGGLTTVSFRLRNTGSRLAADANGQIKIAFFVSTDSWITLADVALGSEFTWSLAAGQYRDISVRLKVPNTLAAGTYYVGWVIDPQDAIRESDEGDNIAYHASKRLTVQ